MTSRPHRSVLGTLSRADTEFCLLFDTDENPAMGNAESGPDSATFGWDYSVCAVGPRGSITAQIARALGPSQSSQIMPLGSSSATFPSADQARVSGINATTLIVTLTPKCSSARTALSNGVPT